MLYFVFTRAQAAANLTAMQTQWAAAFPPLGDPFTPGQVARDSPHRKHVCLSLWRRKRSEQPDLVAFRRGGRRAVVPARKADRLACLAPFGMAMLAAAMRRYPYGGPVPTVRPHVSCNTLPPASAYWPASGPRRYWRSGVILGVDAGLFVPLSSALALVGVIPLAADAFHPYRAVHAQRAREFARQFWPEFVRDAEPVCLRWDLGIGEWDSTNLNVAVYLCNQMIYSPHRRHPQRTVLATRLGETGHSDACRRSPIPLTAGLPPGSTTMKKHYRLTDWRMLAVNMAEPGCAGPESSITGFMNSCRRNWQTSGSNSGATAAGLNGQFLAALE